MTTFFRFIPMALGLLLLCSACGSRNQPVADDDVAVEIELSRRFAQRMAATNDVQIDYQIDDVGDVLFAPLGIGLEFALESSVKRLPRTIVEVYPDDDPAYRQRLYWGRNTVYFPVHAIGPTTRMRLAISGDRVYDDVLEIDLSGVATASLK